MTEVDLRYLESRGEYERVDVGSGYFIILWENGEIGFEHICRGVWRDPSEPAVVYRIAPVWPGAVVCRSPLTLAPSVLCLGAANPCNIHGFVENGVWRDA